MSHLALACAVAWLLSPPAAPQEPAPRTEPPPPLAVHPGPATPGGSGHGPQGAGYYYDNGTTDGSHAYSNGVDVGGARRALLDDFEDHVAYDHFGIEWTHLWASGATPPQGVGAEILYRLDVAGSPGTVTHTAQVLDYSEVPTGLVFFSRPQALSRALHEGIWLNPKKRWIEVAIDGPEEDLWLTRSTVTGSECWVDYSDMGGLQPASVHYGVPRDLNFRFVDTARCAVCDGPFEVHHDNGPPDGSGAYSNFGTNGSGVSHRLLDDFEMPQGTKLRGIRFRHVWDEVVPPADPKLNLRFRHDDTGVPGAVAATTFSWDGYCESLTGEVLFDRPVTETVFAFYPLPLAGGERYWVDATLGGGMEDFWLVRSTVQGSECWVDYSDMGGLQPGSQVYGAPADLSFQLDAVGLDGSEVGNDPDDPINGVSNVTEDVYGARHTVLDDFVLTRPTSLEALVWTHLWVQDVGPSGVGAEILLRSDASGTPGDVLRPVSVVEYCEADTGRHYFERDEYESIARFEPVLLDAGTYWFEATVVCGGHKDGNFWLTQEHLTGAELWVDYADYGGLQPGSQVFGVPMDLNFLFDALPVDAFTFCDPSDGSPNNTATIAASSNSLAAGVELRLSDGPAGQPCYLLLGDARNVLQQPPGAKGDLCLVGGTCLGRYALDLGAIAADGTFVTDVRDSASGGPAYGIPSCGGHLAAGETWYFQYWHRQGGGQPSTFSQALGVTFVD